MKAFLFIALFAMCTCGAMFSPMLGVMGYIAHYNIGPESQWWAAAFRQYSSWLRFSFILATLTGLGMLFNWHQLKFGKKLFLGQEKLVLVFLALVWAMLLIGEETVATRFARVDHPTVKLTKVLIFAFMLTHVVTNVKNINYLFWTLVLGALWLGVSAHTANPSDFVKGRLNDIGGPDFSEANNLGAYLAAILPIIGVQFLRSGWFGKLICAVSGAFAVEGVVLTRSRGDMVGLTFGAITALIMSPRKYRLKVFAGLIVAGACAFSLTDQQFRDRIFTITDSVEQRDASAQSRIELWQGGMKMLKAHPQGVGPGNFDQEIGKYVPKYADRDAHSTYVACATELGFVGITLFAALLINTVLSLRRAVKRSRDLPFPQQDQIAYAGFGLTVAMVTLCGSAITMTLLYMEGFWWFLLMPVCLHRAIDNIQGDEELPADEKPKRVRGRFKPKPVDNRPEFLRRGDR